MTKEERLLLERTIHQALEDKNHTVEITFNRNGANITIEPCEEKPEIRKTIDSRLDNWDSRPENVNECSCGKSCETCVHWGAMDDVCRTCYDFDEWEVEKDMPKSCCTCKHALPECTNLIPHACLECTDYSHWEEDDD
jgi:hypothetical protein